MEVDMGNMLTTVEANKILAIEEDVIRSFNLTSKEQVEVIALQRQLSMAVTEENTHFEELARTSSNAGEQYLLSKRHGLIPSVLKNEKLDPRVVPLLLDILAGSETQVLVALHADDEVQVIVALHALFIHKVVVGDVKLFKRTWLQLTTSKVASASPTDKLFYESMVLADAMYYNPPTASGHVNNMSIATLLFILSYLNNSEDQDLVLTLKHMCDEAVEARRDEIKAWVEENMPDYVSLPLPWVVKCVDMYVV